MPIPSGLRAVDLMMAIPTDDNSTWYEFLKPLLLDRESREAFKFPAQYMFKDIPTTRKSDDYVGIVLDEMDRHGVEKSMISIGAPGSDARRALRDHPDRFFGSYEVNPNLGMEGVRNLVAAHDELGIKAATAFPAGMCPQVPINDKKFYPLYAKCVELDIPICICAGVPGPRVPMGVQDVALLDEVCWFFPELKVVTRHGCEPWTDLAVKLMIKWPNLFYSTSAFAPRHYPKDIVAFANSRGADKIMYAGYFPMGLSLERIFKEMKDVPFKDEVWPKFLSENARRVFKLLGLLGRVWHEVPTKPRYDARMFIDELFSVLASRGVAYAVIGGVAVNLHGVPRMTYDVDIVVPTDEGSLRACREALESIGLRCRLPLVLESLWPLDRRTELEAERNLRAVTFTDPSNPLREVDVLVAPSRDPDGICARAIEMRSGEVAVRVAAVDDIITMKRLSGRTQDLADVAHLERLARRPS